jgi:hypothetical protein
MLGPAGAVIRSGPLALDFDDAVELVGPDRKAPIVFVLADDPVPLPRFFRRLKDVVRSPGVV